jgi:hypothetical protein
MHAITKAVLTGLYRLGTTVTYIRIPLKIQGKNILTVTLD